MKSTWPEMAKQWTNSQFPGSLYVEHQWSLLLLACHFLFEIDHLKLGSCLPHASRNLLCSPCQQLKISLPLQCWNHTTGTISFS